MNAELNLSNPPADRMAEVGANIVDEVLGRLPPHLIRFLAQMRVRWSHLYAWSETERSLVMMCRDWHERRVFHGEAMALAVNRLQTPKYQTQVMHGTGLLATLSELYLRAIEAVRERDRKAIEARYESEAMADPPTPEQTAKFKEMCGGIGAMV